MQQATVNLFADMGVAADHADRRADGGQRVDRHHAADLDDHLAVGRGEPSGRQPVTITGSASDSGGGVVAGVEVSTDGGKTWHPATLTSLAQQTVELDLHRDRARYPSTTIESRAVDDSGNIETPSDGMSVNVSCPCSLLGTAVTPATAVRTTEFDNDSGDGTSDRRSG